MLHQRKEHVDNPSTEKLEKLGELVSIRRAPKISSLFESLHIDGHDNKQQIKQICSDNSNNSK